MSPRKRVKPDSSLAARPARVSAAYAAKAGRADLRKLQEWAKIEILPWRHTATPGPSREQWMRWNNNHGAMLRVACGAMALDKNGLAALAADFERAGTFDRQLALYDASAKFFADMAKTIETAKFRLLVGSAVFGLRLAAQKETGKKNEKRSPKDRAVQVRRAGIPGTARMR